MPTQSIRSRQQFVKVCECGCAQPTLLGTATDVARHRVLNQPMRYLAGHHHRLPPTPYVIDTNGCWIWQGYLNPHGYGQMRHAGQARLSHVVYYEAKFGPVPPGKILDHVAARGCKSRACVNPDHLEPVTRVQNVRRGKHIKLGEAEAIEIIRLAATMKQAEIALLFGVHPAHISKVVSGKYWRPERTG